MDHTKHIEDNRVKWMNENSHKSQLLKYNIMSMNPDVGFYINVEGIEVSKDFFKEEYEQISKSYFSVLKKMDDYYKKLK